MLMFFVYICCRHWAILP